MTGRSSRLVLKPINSRMPRRAGARSRKQAAQVRAEIWNRHRELIVTASIAYLGLATALVAVFAALFGREPAWFLSGAALAAYPAAFREVFISNEYRRLCDAALAEEFTSAELRRLKSRGWRTIDHVEFDRFDVDHVAVGPAGIFVVETKNTNHAWNLAGGAFVNRWADGADKQARTSADNIRALLKQKLGTEFEVRAVLMIWGDGKPHLTEPTRTRRDVTVVTGNLLRDHLLAGATSLDAQQISEISRTLRTFIANKEAHDRRRLVLV